MDVLIVFKQNFHIMYKVFAVMEMHVPLINSVQAIACL